MPRLTASSLAQRKLHADAHRILQMGGPAALARRLGFRKFGGTQRVQNWLYRGIPPAVKVEHPGLFLSTPTAPAAQEG